MQQWAIGLPDAEQIVGMKVIKHHRGPHIGA